ncbi:FtsH protease activity modulator HflK [Methylonatrum kenyense]|uniref:FtsH protease activity modulator HflK n=1 Tax=Methylonatrum kenyense TaxID=455253 RepID=UPI0020C0E3E4|nr:FtsH protease activity modulator HflK [Methylonatrum kenyense]MCK8516123.1 FtsH protease activity modulator HflK [Methylonatrum kenyense]
MSWNEPGRGNRDPWGGSGNQGPPDLDEVVKKLRGKFGGLFGGRGSGSGGDEESGSGGGMGSAGIGIIVGIVGLVWLASGIYIIDEGFRGVELRFGAYTRTTTPGPHWHPPYPIGSVERVNVEQRRVAEIGYQSTSGDRTQKVAREALMLTQDENIVDVRLAVQYQVSDPRQFRFNFRDPDDTLKDVAESALREVVGKRRLDFVLTEGRTEVAQETRRVLTETLDRYEAGLEVVSVDIQDVQPPEQVQGAFEDAIMAREDEQRKINQANAYRNEVLPRAHGEAARIREEAEGYRQQVVALAEGESARFMALLQEYDRAPEVTRERLYLDAMAEIMGRSSKVMIDSASGDPLLYLPLDRLRGGAEQRRSNEGASNDLDSDVLNRRLGTGMDQPSRRSADRSRGDLRSRGGN